LQQAPIAPIEVIPGVPSELSDIILMAIAKEPANRFQSAQAFQSALKSLHAALGPGGTLLRPGSAPAAVSAVPPTVVNVPVNIPIGAPPPPLPPPPVAQAPNAQPWAPPPPQQFPPPAGYGPPPGPYPPSVAPKSSRRGLYMALGSVATLLVLAAAVVEGPKLWHSGASIAAPGNGTQPPAQGVTQPAQLPPASPEGQKGADPIAVQPVEPQPVQPPPAQPPPVQAKPVQAKQLKQISPAQQQPPVQVQQPPPAQQQPPPVQVQQQPPSAQQPPPVQAQQPPPVSSGPSAQQMNELRQEYNLLAIRVSSAKSGLGSIQQQMRRQGLDLRGDILEAESRMDYLMKEAMDSLRANDPAATKSEMQMAERALETIEKFLGL
jgi:hypothetical protein